MAIEIDERECEQLTGLKKRLCEGFKIDQGEEVEMEDHEHKRWLASFRGEVIPPKEKSKITRIRNPEMVPEGVGTELEKLFGNIKFASCGDCKRLRDQMNNWGPEGCKERRDKILARLKANANKRKVLKALFSKTGAKLFLDQAINNCELRQAGIDPPTGVFSNVVSSVSRLFKLNTPPTKEMTWSYGLTTVPERVNDLLPKTLESLKGAGFPEPHLFLDKCPDPSIYEEFGLDYTCHSRNIRTFGNWVTALWELYILKPTADRFVIFQDDFVAYKNLREYLEKCDYPHQGYLNLLTFPDNHQLIRSSGTGWHQSNQKGRGAVALVFNLHAVTTLLSQKHMVNRPKSASRGHKRVDGGIVDAFSKIGWKEYVHNPTLIQHTGMVSSMGNSRHPLSPSWRGEDFDARELIKESHLNTKSIDTEKVGLVGYHCNSGLGELNRQIASNCPIASWLIKPHDWKRTNDLLDDEIHSIICKNGDDRISKFIQASGTLLFCETQYYPGLLEEAKKAGKRLVCIPMMEWTPKKSWTSKVDLFICPTFQCYETLKKEGLPCIHFPWPTDTERFKFQPRRTCNKFLFLNGNGGWGGRKGLSVLTKAKELWPEMPVVVRSQKAVKPGTNLEILGELKDNDGLYSEGDVLLSPHTVDGLGLELMEAMACGMPVISTQGDPWDEIPSIAKVESSISRKAMPMREVDWYSCSPESLVTSCKSLLGSDISQESAMARAWAESRSWELRRKEFFDVVVKGVAR